MRLIKHIKASNLLSFGPDGLDLELHDLNVLIGANGSGKSNFLEILDLLRGLPSERIQNTIARGGGLSEWIWKGADENSVTQMDILIDNPLRHHRSDIFYRRRLFHPSHATFGWNTSLFMPLSLTA